MKWNVSVLRRSGECERTEVADFELSEFFNRIASVEGKAWVLSVERVGDVGDSALVEPDGDELVSQLGKRGWRTNSGKPVDDWKKLAAVWDRNEHPKAATPPARTEPKANAVGKIPSVEEVMAKWGCDRETAQGYIDENMY